MISCGTYLQPEFAWKCKSLFFRKRKRQKTNQKLETDYSTKLDIKLFSGILAERLKTTLNSIIHKDQKGFVINRFIGEYIRLIYDIMTECEI